MRSTVILLFLIHSLSAFSNLDSLKYILSTQSDTIAALVGYELGKKYVGIDLDSSLNYLRDAAKLSETLEFVNGQKGTYRALGALCVRAGGYEESLSWLEKGLALIDEYKLPSAEKVDMLTNLGVVHSYVGKIGRAIEPYLEAVQICRANDLKVRQGRLLNNLGAFYRQLGNYEKALDIYEQSYSLRGSMNDSLGMANVLFNRTATHSMLSNNEKAIEDIDKALVIYQKLGSQEDIILTKISKADALLNLGQNKLAYDIALPISRIALKDIPNLSQFNLYLLLAEISIVQNKPKAAIKYLNTIGSKIENSKYFEQLSQYYLLRGQAYNEIGSFQKAYHNSELYRKTREDISSSQTLAFKEEMQARYETSEKDFQIDLLNKEKAISELRINTQKNRNIILGTGLGLLSVILFLLYKLYQKIVTQNKALQKSEKQKSILLKEIHHRVRNNLQVISSLLSLQARKVKDDTTKEALRVSKSRVQSMALLHQNLYTEEELTGINVHHYISNLCNNLTNTYKVDKQVNIELDIDDMIVDVDSLIPIGLIINEIVCNALKYAFPEKRSGTIKIAFNQKGQEVALRISDNGIGLPDGRLEVKKASLGAKLINSFVDRLRGTINISNNDGADFQMLFPSEAIFANKLEDYE